MLDSQIALAQSLHQLCVLEIEMTTNKYIISRCAFRAISPRNIILRMSKNLLTTLQDRESVIIQKPAS
jgi:hypothetical protein